MLLASTNTSSEPWLLLLLEAGAAAANIPLVAPRAEPGANEAVAVGRPGAKAGSSDRALSQLFLARDRRYRYPAFCSACRRRSLPLSKPDRRMEPTAKPQNLWR